MAIFASLFALIGRFFGKLLTTLLGWASILLFGRVPQDRQVWLAVLTFGSLAWVATIVGVVLPSLGTILIAAVPLPSWVDRDLVRLAMLVAAIVVPAVLGAVTLLVTDVVDRPKGGALVVTILRGYLLAPALALTLLILAVAGSVRKVVALARRRHDAHVAIIVRPGRYEALVDLLERELRDDRLVDRRKVGSVVLTIPARVLARIAGGGIAKLVPERLAVLRGPDLDVDVYPADLAMTGSKEAVAHARAIVTRDVRSTDAWFTTSEEAQKVEDALADLARRKVDPAAPEVSEVDRRLAALTIPQEEWEVLYRRRLQLVADATGDDLGHPPAGSSTGGATRTSAASGWPRRSEPALPGHLDAVVSARPSLETLVGVATSALLLLDLIFAARRPVSRWTRRT